MMMMTMTMMMVIMSHPPRSAAVLRGVPKISPEVNFDLSTYTKPNHVYVCGNEQFFWSQNPVFRWLGPEWKTNIPVVPRWIFGVELCCSCVRGSHGVVPHPQGGVTHQQNHITQLKQIRKTMFSVDKVVFHTISTVPKFVLTGPVRFTPFWRIPCSFYSVLASPVFVLLRFGSFYSVLANPVFVLLNVLLSAKTSGFWHFVSPKDITQ